MKVLNRKIKLFVVFSVFLILFSLSGFHHPLISQGIDSLYVEILSPEKHKAMKSGFNTLWGFIYGPRISLIKEEDISWYSDVDGFLEHGKIANIYKLSTGIHRIIFSVQNHSGYLASDTVITAVQSQYLDEEPIEVDNSGPIFPEDYEAEGIFGICMLIDEAGGVDSVIVVENTVKDLIIEEIILDWAENVKFYPAKENGISKGTWIVRSFKLPIDKKALALAEDKSQVSGRRLGDLDEESSKRIREEQERLRKLLGTGESVAMTGLPKFIVHGFTKLSKKKSSLSGMIKACIRVDFAGFVKEILIIENTFKDDWVEKDLIKMLYNSLYEPVTEIGGSGIRECFTAFVVEDNYFKEMKAGDFTTWKDEYGIEFASLNEGNEVDFLDAEEDITSAVGVFRMIAKINSEGEVKDIKEIERTINHKSLKNIFTDTYKDYEYNPATVNNFPVMSYILPYFSFNNPQYYHFKKLLLSYNSGFQYYIKKKYNLAIRDLKDALRLDSRNDFIGLIPQIVFCYESNKEKDYKKKLRLYEESLRKNAYYRNFDILKKFNEDYNVLKESISEKVSFFSLLPKDRYDLKSIFTFMDRSSIAQNDRGQSAVYEELKYPDKAREAGLEGTVEVALLIKPNSPEKADAKYARILKSVGDKKANKAAIKALKKVNYFPAKLENELVNSWVSRTVTFSLSDKFNVRAGKPERDQINSKRVVPLNRNEIKYMIQTGLPPILVMGKSKFSRANDKTEGYIRACVEIDSTGFVKDILILENTILNDSLIAEGELARMLAGCVFDPINLKGGPDKQRFVSSFNVENKFFVQQRNVVLKNWLLKDAFKFPFAVEENSFDFVPDTSILPIDTTIQPIVITQSDSDSVKKRFEISKVSDEKFYIDWSELDAIVEEEIDSTTEGILEFLFRIDREGNLTILREKHLAKVLNSVKSLLGINFFKSLLRIGKKSNIKAAKAERDVLELKNTLKNAGKLKERIFKSIINYKFVPGVADSIPTNCYVYKRYVFQRKGGDKFRELLKEYNSAYKDILKEKEINAANKLEKVVKSDHTGDFFKVYSLGASYFRNNDKVLKALNLYFDGIKRFAYYNDFDKMNYLADELMIFKDALWEGKDFYSLLQTEKIRKKEIFTVKPEEEKPELADITHFSIEDSVKDTTKIFAAQNEDGVDSLSRIIEKVEQKAEEYDKEEFLTVQSEEDGPRLIGLVDSVPQDAEYSKLDEGEILKGLDLLSQNVIEYEEGVKGYDKKELFDFLSEEDRPKLMGSVDSVSENIKYPKLKEGEIVKGTVVVAVLVDKKGEVKEAEIKESIRSDKFDKEALKAAKKLRFEPAVYNQEPVEYWFILPIKFDSTEMMDISDSDK
ncbi:energy transducer TonB [candidate division KSB1 bacterium]